MVCVKEHQENVDIYEDLDLGISQNGEKCS